MINKKKCILCGCKDHKLIGCSDYFRLGPDLS